MRRDVGGIIIESRNVRVHNNARNGLERGSDMILRNGDIKEIVAEIPEGHKHLRTRILLQDGTGIILQEATVANIVRAYINIKTHPRRQRIVLKGKRLKRRKEDYAEWQLIEEE